MIPICCVRASVGVGELKCFMAVSRANNIQYHLRTQNHHYLFPCSEATCGSTLQRSKSSRYSSSSIVNICSGRQDLSLSNLSGSQFLASLCHVCSSLKEESSRDFVVKAGGLLDDLVGAVSPTMTLESIFSLAADDFQIYKIGLLLLGIDFDMVASGGFDICRMCSFW